MEPSEPSEEDYCRVCGDDQPEEGNEIIFCEICNIAVHQSCYGVAVIPEGDWLCAPCAVNARKAVCCLCKEGGGALKPTSEGTKRGRWCHVTCAWFHAGTCAEDPGKMEPILGCDDVDEEYFQLKCRLTKKKGGACVQCIFGECWTSFIPSAAIKPGSGCVMEIVLEGLEAKRVILCPEHASCDKNLALSNFEKRAKRLESHGTLSKSSPPEKRGRRGLRSAKKPASKRGRKSKGAASSDEEMYGRDDDDEYAGESEENEEEEEEEDEEDEDRLLTKASSPRMKPRRRSSTNDSQVATLVEVEMGSLGDHLFGVASWGTVEHVKPRTIYPLMPLLKDKIVTRISVSHDAAIAITTSQVFCWSSRWKPYSIKELEGLNVTDVAAGGRPVVSEGEEEEEVDCWQFGAIADGAIYYWASEYFLKGLSEPGDVSDTPVELESDEKFSSIRCSGHGSIALSENGAVFTSNGTLATLRKVSMGQAWQTLDSIAITGRNFAAVSNGQVFVWGPDLATFGLDPSSTSPEGGYQPSAVKSLAEVAVKEIHMSVAGSVATGADGKVYQWGPVGLFGEQQSDTPAVVESLSGKHISSVGFFANGVDDVLAILIDDTGKALGWTNSESEENYTLGLPKNTIMCPPILEHRFLKQACVDFKSVTIIATSKPYPPQLRKARAPSIQGEFLPTPSKDDDDEGEGEGEESVAPASASAVALAPAPAPVPQSALDNLINAPAAAYVAAPILPALQTGIDFLISP